MLPLILAIQNRLAAEAPQLQYVDVDWGQLDFYAPNAPVKWPCALIDLQQIAWSSQAKQVQMGLVTIRIRVADLRLIPSSSGTTDAQKQAALAIWGTIRAVNAMLHGWRPTAFSSKLMRTATTRLTREDGMRIFETTYTCEVNDPLDTHPTVFAQLVPGVDAAGA